MITSIILGEKLFHCRLLSRIHLVKCREKCLVVIMYQPENTEPLFLDVFQINDISKEIPAHGRYNKWESFGIASDILVCLYLVPDWIYENHEIEKMISILKNKLMLLKAKELKQFPKSIIGKRGTNRKELPDLKTRAVLH